MVSISEGSFLMGSENGFDNERPAHRVWLDAFLIGLYPVTNGEYRRFVEETGALQPPFWSEAMFCDLEKPVVGITWDEARRYCDWLSGATGKPFRLPTEAEWECAARGGLEQNTYPWGDEHPLERPYPGCDVENGGPARVGQYEPNGFGLYEMSEGVHEWCSDFYNSSYYYTSPERNPQGPPSGKRRVSRGGSWRHRVKFSRCSARSSLDPSFRYADYGFRVAMSNGSSKSWNRTEDESREEAQGRRV
jgi:formylglycine-generating enzyme required for sulfatase activity